MKTPLQVEGVSLEPFNPLTIAIALDASFVARTFAGDVEHMKNIFKEAIKHEGYSLVDIFQPCVIFNKMNTYQWFRENTYKLEDSHDPYNKNKAFKRATETEKYPLGIFYKNEDKLTFEKSLSVYSEDKSPLFKRKTDTTKIKNLIEQKRSI